MVLAICHWVRHLALTGPLPYFVARCSYLCCYYEFCNAATMWLLEDQKVQERQCGNAGQHQARGLCVVALFAREMRSGESDGREESGWLPVPTSRKIYAKHLGTKFSNLDSGCFSCYLVA